MGNMLDYVRNEVRGFDEQAFNEVDALVLAQLAYEDLPHEVDDLDDLEAAHGTLAKRARAFDARHPLASLRRLPHAPFSTLTLAQVDHILHEDETDAPQPTQQPAASAPIPAPGASASEETSQPAPDAAVGNTDTTAKAEAETETNTTASAADATPAATTSTSKESIFAPLLRLSSPGTPTHEPTAHQAHQVHMSNFADPHLAHELHRAAAASPRFAGVTMGAVSTVFATGTDPAAEATQFAAVTYRLNDKDGTLVIAFRGTDDTLAGWKEDFNMAFQYPVPAQRQASAYLRRLTRLWPGPIVLTGHSKGGNLAVHAAMNAPDTVSARIRRIYSFDGPGFPDAVVRSEPYAAIRSRVTKIVPESTVIGMILETPDPCEVVASEETGLMQHFPFSWQVEGHGFVRRDKVAPSSQAFNRAINEWLTTLTPEQCEHAVDALFSVLGAGGATTFAELVASLPMSIPAILGRAMTLDPTERKHIGESLRILLAAATAKPGTAKNG